MAPSPENDNRPKAPDKNDKTKGEHTTSSTLDSDLTITCVYDKEASVTRLDEVELQALLDEAINYKIPKDRVGKSKLFQNLLDKAEDDDRKARATSASGSELVRYYNTTATHRNRRRRETNSVSENLTHGGSLNNLAKEELYTATSHSNKPPKTVSTRQRQGGSLPCNVNAGITPSYDKQFFEEARRKTEIKKVDYVNNDMEADSLLEYDSLNQEYGEQPEIEVVQTRIPRLPVKYTSKFNIEIGGNDIHKTFFSSFPSYPALVFLGGSGGRSVDDTVTVSALERSGDKFEGYSIKPVEVITTSGHYQPPGHYTPYMPSWPFTKKSVEDRRFDENGNALGQSNIDAKKNKKKKIQTDKNVVVVEASNVVGHRSDIINDLDKLIEFIGGKPEQNNTNASKTKSNVHNKTKIHKNHFTSGNVDDKTNVNKKQKARCKPKNEKMHKSNSLEEISVSKLDDFTFSADSDGCKVPLRGTKSNADRPRERRSWGNSESLPLHASAENLETADFRVVTKKKKSKKGRVGQRQQLSSSEFNRSTSPEPRRKSAGSVPHSDKSNDSSDADSVHSLPIEHIGIDEDNSNSPASYAAIAKTSNSFDCRPKWNRLPSERRTKSVDKSLAVSVDNQIEIVSPPPPPPPPPQVKTKSVNTQTQTIFRSPHTDSLIENYPHEVRHVQNWQIVNNQNNNRSVVLSSSNALNKTNHKHNKNIKHNNLRNVQQSNDINVNAAFRALHNSEHLNHVQILPPNIPDVQTIEKLHFKQLQHMMQVSQSPNNFVYPPEIVSHNRLHQQLSVNHINSNNVNVQMPSYDMGVVNTQYFQHQAQCVPIENCDSDRTNSRPAVVILSGGGNKEVPGLTFGFEINEQLLSDDVCDIFTSRFVVPNIFQKHNHDKIVNFIGVAWEDTIGQTSGRVKYYTDQL